MKTIQYDNIKVAIRIRPLLDNELTYFNSIKNITIISPDSKSVSLVEYLGTELFENEVEEQYKKQPQLFRIHQFTFDHIFNLNSQQIDIYNTIAKHSILSILEGYNSTIFCYGQTGAGKTYTMEGPNIYNNLDLNRGIIQRAIEDIFKFIENLSNENTKYIIRVSFLQIYKENITDLLKQEKKNLHIREDKKKGIIIEDLSEWVVRSPSEFYTLLQNSANNRISANTYMNNFSSRSHALYILTIEQMTTDNKTENTSIKIGKLNLVDLAGSERFKCNDISPLQLSESININKSLSCLGNVINALTDKKSKGRIYIPYRDSKLTRILQDSLGGNCKTTLLAMISPSAKFFGESLSTLYFAQRAKKIKNKPIINEDMNESALIKKYEIQLKNLKLELKIKNNLLKNNELVMQLKKENKKLVKDKSQVLSELEKITKQYLLEKEKKLLLEKKIEIMNSQMIIGGKKISENQFQSVLQNQLQLNEVKMFESYSKSQNSEENILDNEKYKKESEINKNTINSLKNKINEKEKQINSLKNEINNYKIINLKLIQRISNLENILQKENIEFPKEENINFLNPLNKKYMNIFNLDGDINQIINKSCSELYNQINDFIKQNEELQIKINEQNKTISNLKKLININEKKYNQKLNEISKNIISKIEDMIKTTKEIKIKKNLLNICKYFYQQKELKIPILAEYLNDKGSFTKYSDIKIIENESLNSSRNKKSQNNKIKSISFNEYTPNKSIKISKVNSNNNSKCHLIKKCHNFLNNIYCYNTSKIIKKNKYMSISVANSSKNSSKNTSKNSMKNKQSLSKSIRKKFILNLSNN